MMLGAARSAETDLLDQLRGMGSRILAVRAGTFLLINKRVAQVAGFTTLSRRDEFFLRENLSSVQRLSGFAAELLPVRYRDRQILTTVAGVELDYFEMHQIKVDVGQTWSPEEDRGLARSTVLGSTVAEKLFGEAPPLGLWIRINGVPFEVIGFAHCMGGGRIAEARNDSIYLPLRSALVRVLSRTHLDSIFVQVHDGVLLDTAASRISELLRESHGLANNRPNDFTIQDPVALLRMEANTGETFRILLAALAGTALLTGGFGIFAVMQMSVRERTSEIGLRRAIGARRRDILVQFLLEGAFLGSLGGGAGVIVGLIGNAIVCNVSGWETQWPFGEAAWAILLATSLGILFGLYPALRAAKIEPVVALRSSA